jgi:L-fucose isomerase-like protein
METIALIQFASPLHEAVQLAESHRVFLDSLRDEFELIDAPPGATVGADLCLVFIASGGVEGRFRDLRSRLPKPALLLTDGRHNSLAAALEIMSWLRRQGEKPELLHGDPPHVCARLHQLVRFERTRRALSGRLGIIGPPSDWLIGSEVDYSAATRRWGTTFCPIELTEVETLAAAVGMDEATDVARRFISASSGLEGISERQVVDAARLYPAMKKIFERYRLDAATLRCFSLLEDLGTSGCLALSRLNDEGLICGCEGDVASTFSMLLLHALTGALPFMANPSRIDAAANDVTLAHCTVAGRATRSYRIRSHFESGLGVGIQGDLAPGPVTLFKLGGPELNEYFVAAAGLLDDPRDEEMCRTQARLHLRDESVDYFFRAPLANHHTLVSGDHTDEVRHFMEYAGCGMP